MDSDEEMIDKTRKLIAKLQLQPNEDESKYSQSFIDRERGVIKNLMKKTQSRINEKKNEYVLKQKSIQAYQRRVIDDKLGLKRKLTKQEKIMQFSEQTIKAKQKKKQLQQNHHRFNSEGPPPINSSRGQNNNQSTQPSNRISTFAEQDQIRSYTVITQKSIESCSDRSQKTGSRFQNSAVSQIEADQESSIQSI